MLLTGGASRLPIVGELCEQIFPQARLVRAAEPEFAIATGLAWFGRFDQTYRGFTGAISELVAARDAEGEPGPLRRLITDEAGALGPKISPVLVDGLIDAVITPTLKAWRDGDLRKLDDLESELNRRAPEWLASAEARTALTPALEEWFIGLQRDVERLTDPVCHHYGLPTVVLSLASPGELSRDFESLDVDAPSVDITPEGATAVAGLVASTATVTLGLAQIHALAPLLAHPLGMAVATIVGAAGVVVGRRAFESWARGAVLPGFLRRVVSDERLERAARSSRTDLIEAVETKWGEELADAFADRLSDALARELTERSEHRSILFIA